MLLLTKDEKTVSNLEYAAGARTDEPCACAKGRVDDGGTDDVCDVHVVCLCLSGLGSPFFLYT